MAHKVVEKLGDTHQRKQYLIESIYDEIGDGTQTFWIT